MNNNLKVLLIDTDVRIIENHIGNLKLDFRLRNQRYSLMDEINKQISIVIISLESKELNFLLKIIQGNSFIHIIILFNSSMNCVITGETLQLIKRNPHIEISRISQIRDIILVLRVQKKILEAKEHLIKLPNNIIWDSNKNNIFQNKNEIKLTKNEKFLFELFATSSDYIIEFDIYEDDNNIFTSKEQIKQIIKRLNKKLKCVLIVSIYRIGWKLKID